jgi:hypothetical protein
MNTNKLFPFMGLGKIADGTDMNTIKTPGFYHIGSYVTNGPEFNWSCVCVFKTHIITQIAFGLSDKGVSYRTCEDVVSPNWSPWQRIDNFGCNTLNELAAALKPELGL